MKISIRTSHDADAAMSELYPGWESVSWHLPRVSPEQKEVAAMYGAPPVEVRSIETKGRGVFATAFIEKDATILPYEGTLIPATRQVAGGSESELCYTFIMLGLLYARATPAGPIIDGFFHPENSSRIPAGSLINQSCDPNLEFYADDELNIGWYVASRDIQENEEITTFYGVRCPRIVYAMVKSRYKCLCGSANCTGSIVLPVDFEGSAKSMIRHDIGFLKSMLLELETVIKCPEIAVLSPTHAFIRNLDPKVVLDLKREICKALDFCKQTLRATKKSR